MSVGVMRGRRQVAKTRVAGLPSRTRHLLPVLGLEDSKPHVLRRDTSSDT